AREPGRRRRGRALPAPRGARPAGAPRAARRALGARGPEPGGRRPLGPGLARRAHAGPLVTAGRRLARVALLGRVHRPGVAGRLAALERRLVRRGVDVTLMRGTGGRNGTPWVPDRESVRRARAADLVVTLGGDGTSLAGAR